MCYINVRFSPINTKSNKKTICIILSAVALFSLVKETQHTFKICYLLVRPRAHCFIGAKQILDVNESYHSKTTTT